MDELEGIQMAARREARLRARDVKTHDPRIPVANGQLGDLRRSGELPHGGHDGPDGDGRTDRRGSIGTALESEQPGLHHLIQAQPALRGQLGCVANLGIHHAVRGQVQGTLGGDPLDGRGCLHHADRVRESVEVQLQALPVRTLPEPATQLPGVVRRQPRVAGLTGQLDDGQGSQASVQVVVQQDLGGGAHGLQ